MSMHTYAREPGHHAVTVRVNSLPDFTLREVSVKVLQYYCISYLKALALERLEANVLCHMHVHIYRESIDCLIIT